jgi:type IV pilus assembly protein PilA
MIRSIQRKFKKSRGFTLVELMIVVAIVGILAALAIYGVRKYMANAKSAEAKNSLGQMTKDASAAFNREKMDGAVLAGGSSTAVTNTLCQAATAKVPASPDSIKGKKYQSAQTEWDADSQLKGWSCVKFSMAEPQYYQYGYANTGTTGAEGDTFDATAEGDLDGDGSLSLFKLSGKIQSRTVAVSPNIIETNPEE